MARRLTAAVVLGLLVAAGTAGSSSTASPPPSSAHAVAIQVIVPGSAGSAAGVVSAPPDAAGSGGGFAYPDDGSVASSASVSAKASAVSARTGSASASSAEADSLSLFAGEITAGAVAGAARAAATPSGGSGDFSGAAVSDLVVLGQPVAAVPGAHVALGDWGYVDVLVQAVTPGTATGAPSYQESMTALAVHLTADHGGLPAGSAILVGSAEAAAQGANPAPPRPPAVTTVALPPTTTVTEPAPAPPQRPAAKPRSKPAAKTSAKGRGNGKPSRRKPLKPPEPAQSPLGPSFPLVHNAPLTVTPKLTASRYVFPVYGPSSYTDTFGAPRADVVWHHGDDIFAPLGAPILAVADGMVFSVGWNHLGGYRVWLRDSQGNEFYYAHLSAYSPLAVNGRFVRAGTVLGFVGNTGDAVGTPYHLHFEVHPVSLLTLGYDGAVDPTRYLDAWKHLQDVRFTPEGWAPPRGKAKRGVKPAPPPGAFLLSATDIATASGLDPASLARVLAPASHEGDGALVGATQSPPRGPHPVWTLRARWGRF